MPGTSFVAAALLHDVGHFTSEFGAYSPQDAEDKHHDDAGAQVLAPFFPPVVSECVRLHVAAKRYLCAADPGYFAKLSEASVHTLALQGGPMNEHEAAEFRSNPFHTEAVRGPAMGRSRQGRRHEDFEPFATTLLSSSASSIVSARSSAPAGSSDRGTPPFTHAREMFGSSRGMPQFPQHRGRPDLVLSISGTWHTHLPNRVFRRADRRHLAFLVTDAGAQVHRVY